MVLQVVRTSVFLVAPLSVSKVLFHCFETASKPTYKHLLSMGSSKSPYINQCSIKRPYYQAKLIQHWIAPPSSWWINPTHSKKDREKRSNLWGKNHHQSCLVLFHHTKNLIQQFGHSNKSSNQKYPASLKQFSVQENYNTTRYRTPQPIPLANYERSPIIACW